MFAFKLRINTTDKISTSQIMNVGGIMAKVQAWRGQCCKSCRLCLHTEQKCISVQCKINPNMFFHFSVQNNITEFRSVLQGKITHIYFLTFFFSTRKKFHSMSRSDQTGKTFRLDKLQKSNIAIVRLQAIGIRGRHIESPPDTLRTSQHYGTEGFKEGPQLSPLVS